MGKQTKNIFLVKAKSINTRSYQLCLYIMICFYYYSYRYILQYNSSRTSPTYSDTPLTFKVVKYILFVLLITRMLVKSKCLLAYSRKNKDIFSLTFFCALQMSLIGVLTFNTDALYLSFVFSFLLFFYNPYVVIELDALKRMLMTFYIFTTIYEIIQILLYMMIGRLPALAYATDSWSSVRFGGAFDDPNAYALILIFYFYYFVFEYSGKIRSLLITITLGMLVLTWSGTAILAFLGTGIVMLFFLVEDTKMLKLYKKFLFFVLIFAIVVFALYGSTIADFYFYFIKMKNSSIQAHLSGWDLSYIDWLTYLGFFPNHSGSEVGYVRLLKIGGIPALIAFLLISLKIVIRLKLKTKIIHRNKAILTGMLAYSIAFMIGMLNLSFIIIMPCMGLFMCCVVVAVSKFS